MQRRLLVLGILLLAAFLRLYLLHSIPPGLYPDEAMNGVDALKALEHADFKVFYPDNNGREGLFINLQALSIQLFGISSWSLRVVSALAGTLTVLFFYLLAREIFLYFLSSSKREGDASSILQNVAQSQSSLAGEPKRTVDGMSAKATDRRWSDPIAGSAKWMSQAHSFALLAAFLLTVSFWHINFSRIGFRAILLPLLSTAAFYYLFHGLRTKRSSRYLLSGAALGLALSTYIASRIVPLLFLPFFVMEAKKRFRDRAFRKHWLIFVSAFLLTILPLAGYFIVHPQDFVGRAGDVSVFSSDNPVKTLLSSTAKTLLMFTIHGDENWRHNVAGSPLLDPITGLFFLMGIGIALSYLFSKGKRAFSLFLLGWFGLLLVPSITTAEGLPHALRSLGAIPSTFLLASLGGLWLFNAFVAKRTPMVRMSIIATTALVLLIGNFHQYFYAWAQNPNVPGAFREDVTNIASYLNAHADQKRYVIINENGVLLDGVPVQSATIRFLTGDTKDITYLTPDQINHIEPREELQKTVILPTLPPGNDLEASLRALFPTIQKTDANGVVVYVL